VGDPNQLAPSVALFHLTIDQARRHLPLTHVPASTTSYEPVSKMSGESIEVHIESIAGEERNAARSQELSQEMDDLMGRVLCARTQRENGKKLGARIDDQPQHLGGASQSGSNFVQLQVRDMQVAEGVLMEELSVLTCASEPRRDGGLSVAEDPFGSGRVQPFGQRCLGFPEFFGEKKLEDYLICSS
jgi:hypothetical protein